jgi:phenylalanyl-tRNA synthetase beta chain
VIELGNPLSEEASVMRTSMVPGVLNMLAYNLNRGSRNVRLFEAGNVFEASDGAALELKRVCMGATGSADGASVHQVDKPISFFNLKGDVEILLTAFQHDALVFKLGEADYYHPGRSATAVMDGEVVAQFGQIHPEVATSRKLRQDVFVAEIFLDRLLARGLRTVRYEALPRYPAVERDFSFVFEDSVSFEKIEKAVKTLRIPELRGLDPVEIFRGGSALSIAARSYSLLLRATFQSHERTLRDDEIVRWSEEIIGALKKLGGTQRA